MSHEGLDCALTYVGGYRAGQPCPYRASEVIVLQYAVPFLACGYHARAYGSNVRYDLTWNLTEKRRWQRMNIDRLVAALPEGGRR